MFFTDGFVDLEVNHVDIIIYSSVYELLSRSKHLKKFPLSKYIYHRVTVGSNAILKIVYGIICIYIIYIILTEK